MTSEFYLPDIGEGLTEAEIVAWLVQPGETISVDQPVVVLETAKTTVEIPSPHAGMVVETRGAVGEKIEVGELLLSVAAAERQESEVTGDVPVLVGSGKVEHPVRRARVALPGADGTRIQADRCGTAQTGLRTVPPGESRLPLSGRRRAVAEKVSRSRREVPDATCWAETDASGLLAARDVLASESGIGVLALLARVCVAGLSRHPELNGYFDPDRNEAVRLSAIHLGIAMETPHGLVIPVVRDAQQRTTQELSDEIRRLTERARAGGLAPAEVSGSTMTLNNYGVLGADGATPILNYPEVAMLGVGRISRRPWVVGDHLDIRPVVRVAVTFDHRVCDGGPPGAFLRFVAQALTEPVRLLLQL